MAQSAKVASFAKNRGVTCLRGDLYMFSGPLVKIVVSTEYCGLQKEVCRVGLFWAGWTGGFHYFCRVCFHRRGRVGRARAFP